LSLRVQVVVSIQINSINPVVCFRSA